MSNSEMSEIISIDKYLKKVHILQYHKNYTIVYKKNAYINIW